MEHSIYQTRKNRFGKISAWVFLGITAATGFALVLGYVVMLLWNWLMPEIFGLITVTYWQAVGIIIFAKLLLGSFGCHKSNNHEDRFHDRFKKKISKENLSQWKNYDRFWKEKGEQAYNDFLEQIDNDN